MSQHETPIGELTDESYWLDFWRLKPTAIGASRGPIHDFVREEWLRLLSEWVRPGERWIEIGCANSTFLYDFPLRLGASLDGVDIARDALAATETAVNGHNIKPRLSIHDYRDIPPEELGKYDGVISYGFAEHFVDCAEVHRQLARYVRDGGMVVTIVPNLTGVLGLLQQWVDEATFLKHNILTPQTLKGALSDAGLEVAKSAPAMALNMAVINPASRSKVTRLALMTLLVGISRAFAALQTTTGYRVRPKLWRSPYIVGVARKSGVCPGTATADRTPAP